VCGGGHVSTYRRMLTQNPMSDLLSSRVLPQSILSARANSQALSSSCCAMDRRAVARTFVSVHWLVGGWRGVVVVAVVGESWINVNDDESPPRR